MIAANSSINTGSNTTDIVLSIIRNIQALPPDEFQREITDTNKYNKNKNKQN
jgi:hypothetical protein